MKNKLITIWVVVFSLVLTVTTVFASSFTYLKISGTYNYDEANRQLDCVNNERKKAGVSQLEMDYELTKKAQERAREVALYFSHTRTNGEDVLRSLGVYSENIAAGSRTAEAVTDQWMNSNGHKANILNKSMKSIGIASFTTENNITYWVEVFSISKAASSKRFKGNEENNFTIKTKLSYIKKLKISDLENNKKIKLGEDYTVSKLQLRNEGWTSVFTTISNDNAIWFNSNTNVATIDKKGTIKTLSEGETNIIATINNISICYKIMVVKETKIIPIENIYMNQAKLNINVGESVPLSVKFVPENANTSRSLSWESTNEKVLNVDNNGKITGINVGKASILARSSNGKVAVCEVIVEEKDRLITNIILDNTTNTLSVGSTWKVESIVFPTDATEKVLYKSSNNKIATIDNDGIIRAKSVGEVEITGYSKNISKTFKITIKDTNSTKDNETPKIILIDGVSLNAQEVTIKVGEKFQFKYSISPNNSTEEANATWTWTDYKIATLDSKGLLTARRAGEGKCQ